jgi:predicted Zn finger-like uncharacterized protein
MLVRCPHCETRLKVRDELAGKTGRCPKCSKEFRMTGDAPAATPSSSLDFEAEPDEPPPRKATVEKSPPKKVKAAAPEHFDDEYGAADAPRLLAATRTVKKKKSDDESEEGAGSDTQSDKPKRRLRRRTTLGMLASLVDAGFWESALRRSAYLAGGLTIIGALVGFLVGLIHSAIVAGMVLQMIGIPTAFLVFFMMCYPTACFWKVMIGSAEGGKDIAEWPEPGNFGEWMFEMMFVGYLVVISSMLCGGIAKFGEIVIPHEGTSQEYWRLIGTEEEIDTVSLPGKLLAKMGKGGQTVEMQVTSPRPVLRPGPAWITMLIAFAVVFPFVVVSCLEPSTPTYIPWSGRVWFSLINNFPAWLVSIVLSFLILGAAVAVLVLGATYAPFITFTLCSPLAVIGLLFYGRLIGRLSWLIART